MQQTPVESPHPSNKAATSPPPQSPSTAEALRSFAWRRTKGRDRYDNTCWDGDKSIGRVRLMHAGTKAFWQWSMAIEHNDVIATSSGVAPTRAQACQAVTDAYERLIH